MPEIRVVQTISDFEITLDWLLRSDGTLDDTQALETVVIVALGTDRRADPDDALPDPDDDHRRGWWGDTDAETLHGGWPIGSRLWLLARSKITSRGAREGALIARVEAYIREALEPLLEIGLASDLAVSVERLATGTIAATVTLIRNQSRDVTLRFAVLWD